MTVARSRGGPPPLAVPLCQEVSPLTSWLRPGAPAEAMGMAVGPGAPNLRRRHRGVMSEVRRRRVAVVVAALIALVTGRAVVPRGHRGGPQHLDLQRAVRGSEPGVPGRFHRGPALPGDLPVAERAGRRTLCHAQRFLDDRLLGLHTHHQSLGAGVLVPCTAAIRPRMNPSDPLRGARHSFRQPASGVIRGMLVSVDPSPVLMGVSASTRFTGRGERAIQKKEW